VTNRGEYKHRLMRGAVELTVQVAYN